MMELTYIDLLGTIAGMLTSGSFAPQVYRIWRTKDTHAISLKM
ncbi:PQ-loop domain-containing transporter [Alphaproteobacteria bacterium]|nr:PQ-loop domain-containing transporter [Alphaproteobacteria bacterium]